ncbi:MAG: SAM-dependent methyltransferase [Kiritimatiellia bacterium]
MPARTHVLLTRPSFEDALVAEASDRWPAARPVGTEPGLVVFESAGDPPAGALAFERQRIPDARFLAPSRLKPVTPATAGDVLGTAGSSGRLWTTHVYTSDPEAGEALASRAAGIEAAMRREGARLARDAEKRFRPHEKLARRPNGGLVVQFCLTPAGLWHGTAELREISSRRPGGLHRMAFDPRAPSRSYLKMEEALERLGVEPAAGEKVVDLGAAPGGWSFAFLKRGCDVTAVDNGPMKIDGLEGLPGRLTHLREDGVAFAPQNTRVPVDWLVADMLIPPGVAMGLLRRWLGQGGRGGSWSTSRSPRTNAGPRSNPCWTCSPRCPCRPPSASSIMTGAR